MKLAERLRTALSSPPTEPLVEGDLPELRAAASREAAVLIAITERDEPGVLLTVRRDTLRTHAGQIAFPGGRIDAGESATVAALREAKEELGLEPSAVELVGRLERYRTVTGYVVTPVIGVVPAGLDLKPHEPEVAEWFEAPLQFLLKDANRRLDSAVFAGRERHYYVIEWNGRTIWGATAAMLVNLSKRLQWN